MSDGLQAAMDLAEETLSGDLRDAMLTHVRSMETPWSKLSQRDQEDRIDAIERGCSDLVRRAVNIVARRGFDTIPVKIADFTVKGGAIKGKFEAIVTEPNVVALSDHQGHSAVIVLTDASDFIGESAPATADPDEPALPLDEEDDGDDMQPVGEAMPDLPNAPVGEDELAGA